MRFKVGEMAILAVARRIDAIPLIGQQCEILVVGPFSLGQTLPVPQVPCIYQLSPNGLPGDYVVRFRDGGPTHVMDWQLRKINPPEEPKSMKRTEEAKV